MKKTFRFVYSFARGEIPEAIYLKANNLTNARAVWEDEKDEEDVLMAIFLDGKELWRSDINTGFQLEVIK